jgi:NAD(P)H-dependent FMN reductase
MPSGSTLEVHTIEGIPLYNADDEVATGIPQTVADLKDAIAAADGLLLATPEYNNSLPGVLKNAIDWLSRPPADIKRVFGGKPVAVIGATPGGFGTILSQDAWHSVFRHLGASPWFGGRLLVSHANKMIDSSGAITDDKTRDQLKQFVQGFTEFVREPTP